MQPGGIPSRGTASAAQARGGPLRKDDREARAHADQSRNALSEEAGEVEEARYQAVIVAVGNLPVCEERGCFSALASEEWTALAEYKENLPRPPAERVHLPSAGIRHELAEPAPVRWKASRPSLTTAGRTTFPYLQWHDLDRRRHVRLLSIDRPRSELHAARSPTAAATRSSASTDTPKDAKRWSRRSTATSTRSTRSCCATASSRWVTRGHLPRRPAQLPGAAGRRHLPAGRHLGSGNAQDQLQPGSCGADEVRRRHRSGRMAERDRAAARHASSTAAAASSTPKRTKAETRCYRVQNERRRRLAGSTTPTTTRTSTARRRGS